MVETSLAVVQLLKLVALLFPVVALLLQLQHRAADSVELKTLGLGTGMSLLALLSISFLQLSLYLISVRSLPPLLAIPLLAMAVISLLLPLLIVLASEQFAGEILKVLVAFHDATGSIRGGKRTNSETTRSEDAENDDEQN